MYIYVSKLAIIGADDGLSPGRRQTIFWTNAWIWYILLYMTDPLGTKLGENLIETDTFSFKKMHLKMYRKMRPFCLSLNVLMLNHHVMTNAIMWLK